MRVRDLASCAGAGASGPTRQNNLIWRDHASGPGHVAGVQIAGSVRLLWFVHLAVVMV